MCYKVKSAGAKGRSRLVSLSPDMGELAHGASVPHRPARQTDSLTLSRLQMASQHIVHNIESEPFTKIEQQ